MPQTLPLGRDRYVAYLKTDPLAPKQEPARTHEVKGRKRHGEGVAYRLFGPHAVVIGQWTGVRMTAQEELAYMQTTLTPEGIPKDRNNGWGRLIEAHEMDDVANHAMREKLRIGWTPPKYHWRRYYDMLIERIFPSHLLSYNAYGDVHIQPSAAAQYWWRRAKALYLHWRGQELDSGKVVIRRSEWMRGGDGSDWKPLQTQDDE